MTSSSDGVGTSQMELVEVTYAADLDRDDLEEFIEEEHPDADYVKINDRQTGDWLESKGERPLYICPDCGEEAYSITGSGGKRTYRHGVDEDSCVVTKPGWEESDGEGGQTSGWKSMVKSALPHVGALGATGGIMYIILRKMSQSTITVNGEPAMFPPGNAGEVVLAVLGIAALVMLALQWAPGMAGGQR